MGAFSDAEVSPPVATLVLRHGALEVRLCSGSELHGTRPGEAACEWGALPTADQLEAVAAPHRWRCSGERELWLRSVDGAARPARLKPPAPNPARGWTSLSTCSAASVTCQIGVEQPT